VTRGGKEFEAVWKIERRFGSKFIPGGKENHLRGEEEFKK
jgi:hypothetical protein